ncbi:DUF3105 domain-containing protein [Streptomyces sp. RFCAC02]|uniref:DUF3105 domain-containing protein n=1 Tax=Streptomyces sp. RFCAC02 TaxID=2499143 RepID=UPI00101F1CB2|nr:DUF3105 domain-containing protein [Streptomyces sp. RFCAC02]
MGTSKTKKGAAADRRAKIAEARRLERARDRRYRIITITACTVILAAIVGGGAWFVVTSDDDDSGATVEAAVDGERTYADLSSTHVSETVDYPQTPPVGGNHNPVWMNCDGDVYTEAIPNENAVHSLEHGAVWVTYNDAAAGEDIDVLAERVSTTPYSLMSPVAEQASPITLTAWGHQLALDSASDPRVAQFFEEYVQGPQTLEPGAACSGGMAQ